MILSYYNIPTHHGRKTKEHGPEINQREHLRALQQCQELQQIRMPGILQKLRTRIALSCAILLTTSSAGEYLASTSYGYAAVVPLAQFEDCYADY